MPQSTVREMLFVAPATVKPKWKRNKINNEYVPPEFLNTARWDDLYYKVFGVVGTRKPQKSADRDC